MCGRRAYPISAAAVHTSGDRGSPVRSAARQSFRDNLSKYHYSIVDLRQNHFKTKYLSICPALKRKI
jgi:hypothetical protein